MTDEKESKELALPKAGDHEGWEKKLSQTLSLGERASALVPGTVKKLDMALSNGVEGFFYLLRGDKLQVWNARRRLAAQMNARKLLEEYSRMDESDITIAPMEVEVPLLEKLSSSDDDKLSDILIKLLIAASSKKNGHLVHPSMVSVAENLSPDEALILNTFKNPKERYPMIDVNYVDNRPEMKRATRTYAKYFSGLNELPGLVHPHNVDFYIENLISLGLFDPKPGFIPVKNQTGGNIPHPDYVGLQQKAKELFTSASDQEHMVFSSSRFILKPTVKGEMFIKILNSIEIPESAKPETTTS